MQTYTCEPYLNAIGSIENPIRKKEEIEAETMLFSARWFFARENGGEITQEIMDVIFQSRPFVPKGHELMIDTRVQMLLPGWWPSIPGWHCDFIPRDADTGQPVLQAKNTIESSWTCIVATAADVSQTEFLVESVNVHYDSEAVWSSINKDIEYMRTQRKLKTGKLQLGKVMLFGSHTLHRAMQVHNPGWRYFFRCSIVKEDSCQNLIRQQTQIYVPDNYGW